MNIDVNRPRTREATRERDEQMTLRIAELRKLGLTLTVIAKRFGCGHNLVQKLAKGK